LGGGPPNLITNVATTDASVPDSVMTEPIHHDLAERDLLPDEHYVDSGYPSADLLVSSLTDYGVRLVTPDARRHLTPGPRTWLTRRAIILPMITASVRRAPAPTGNPPAGSTDRKATRTTKGEYRH
jgi:hypothetical protein